MSGNQSKKKNQQTKKLKKKSNKNNMARQHELSKVYYTVFYFFSPMHFIRMAFTLERELERGDSSFLKILKVCINLGLPKVRFIDKIPKVQRLNLN